MNFSAQKNDPTSEQVRTKNALTSPQYIQSSSNFFNKSFHCLLSDQAMNVLTNHKF